MKSKSRSSIKDYLITLSNLILFIVLFSSYKKQEKGVHVNSLVRKSGLYFLVGDAKPFTGKAYDYYSSNQIQFYFEYKKGNPSKLIKYNQIGVVVSEENYNIEGRLIDKYFKGADSGDTLAFGFYKDGQKNGRWVVLGEDSLKYYYTYVMDSLVKKSKRY